MSTLIIIAIVALGVSLYDYFDSKDWQHITAVHRINVVFEERNKKYGAYSIRRDYNDLILFIMIGVMVLFGAFSIASFGLRVTAEEIKVPVVEIDTTLMTLEAPPMEHIETIPTPFKVVGGNGGSGSPDNSKYDPTPQPQVKEQDTQAKSDNKVFSGKGHATTGKDQNQEATTIEKSPFSGSGGKNGGDKTGLFGKDKGPGSGEGGEGPGSGRGGSGEPKRHLVTALPTSQIQSDENCTVVVKVRVSPDGDVTATPIYVRSGSTTDNSVIIKEVIRIVKSHAKFNKVAGNTDQTFNLKVNVSAN
jgi:hypothetical protein